MTAKKRKHQAVSRAHAARLARESAEAEAAAHKRAARRRMIGIGAAAAAAVVLAVSAVAMASGDGKHKKKSASPTSTSTSITTTTTAGKACVAVSDPLPAGAPAVPVKVGPAPASLVIEDLKPGTGAAVTANETLTVNYIGVACSTGKIFDSSYSRNQPSSFPLSGVIKGWQDGLVGTKVGGQRLLGIPSGLAYGPSGKPPTIGPDEALWFVVEVLDAKA